MNVDLRAGNATKLFEIEPSSWVAIFKRVFWVTAGVYAGDFWKHYSTVPSHRQLYQACWSWRWHTYPDILAAAEAWQVATEIAEGFDRIRACLTDYRDNFELVQDRVLETYEDITAHVERLQADADSLDERIAAFVSINEQVDGEVGSIRGFDGSWQLGDDHLVVHDALRHVRDHWHAFAEALDTLRDMLSEYIGEDVYAGDIDMLADDMKIAVDDWNRAAQTAGGFRESQANIDENYYYTGDFIYDMYSIIDENSRYRLTLKSLGENIALDTQSLAAAGTYSGQYWKFTRVGYGCYTLTNDYTGPETFLTISWFDPYIIDLREGDWWLDGPPEGEEQRQFPTGTYYAFSQVWRVIPAGDGYVFLVNMKLGEAQPLGVRTDRQEWDEVKTFLFIPIERIHHVRIDRYLESGDVPDGADIRWKVVRLH